MSTATKLLRRALNSLNNLEDQLKDLGYGWLGGPQLKEEIETFLAAEPEAEAEPVRNNAFDAEICPVCGYYCNGKGGFGCIDKPVLTGLRKPPRPEPAIRKPMTEDEIPEAKPVYQIAMAEGSTSTAWIDVAKDVFDDAGMYPEYKRRALYTRPEPSRKPMTQEEIIQGVTVDTSDDFHAGYWAGVRWAEKHHFGIGVNQSDPDSINLQSRCRGDKL